MRIPNRRNPLNSSIDKIKKKFKKNIFYSGLLMVYGHLIQSKMWVPIISIGKVSDGYIRDLGFNLRLHQKLIGVLV